VLIGELQAFEAKSLPSGFTRYAAPEGLHDDMVMSLAIAWSGLCVRREVQAEQQAYTARLPQYRRVQISPI
jgi:hypothetical protein